MILRSGKGCNDPKDLERVLPVLDRRLYDGGDGGVVLDAGLGAEASADLELGLGGAESLLAVVVRRRDLGIGQEGEDVVPVRCDALLELVKFSITASLLRVDRRSGEQFVKSFLHLRPHVLPDSSLIPAMDRVPKKVHHVKAPGIVREGLHSVGEIPQQMGDAYLVVLHPDIRHKVGRPPVRHPRLAAELRRSEVAVDDAVSSAAVKGEVCRHGILERPEPVVLAADVDSGLVRSGDFSVCDLLADHFVRGLGKLPHGVQHIGYGTFADMKPEYSLEKMREPLEWDVLIGAQIRHERCDVRPEGRGGIDRLGELSLAAVAAGAFDPHLEMLDDFGGNGKRNINHLPRRAHRCGVHVQRLSAFRADGRREPALRIGDILRLKPRASRMSLLPSGRFSGRLAQGLRVRNSDGILGRRHAAVRAGLGNWLPAGLKFRDAGFESGDLLFIMDNAAIQGIVGESLLVKLFGEFRRFEILGITHLAEKLFAPAGELYPVRFNALTKPGIEVLFHTAKVGKEIRIYKFNKLRINGLKAIYGPLGKLCTRLFGGTNKKLFDSHSEFVTGCNGLIFSGLNACFAV